MKRTKMHLSIITLIYLLLNTTNAQVQHKTTLVAGGNNKSSKSGKGLKDVIGNNYKTVVIGDQEWMAENLKTTKYCDGTPIPLVADEKLWHASNGPMYCIYNQKLSLSDYYLKPKGAFYNWYTVNTKKLCPSGWHVPSHSDWETLAKFVAKTMGGCTKIDIGWSNIGSFLKDSTDWNMNRNGNNAFGFSGIPEGFRNYEGWFQDHGYNASWWSATAVDNDKASSIRLDDEFQYFSYDEMYKGAGFNVRCVRDK